jgi:hypothetical protein
MKIPILAIFLLAAISCSGDGPTGNGGLSGTFDLVTVDGVPPPKVESINMSLDTLFFTGAEMRVLSRGRISMVRRHRWHSSARGPLPEDPDTAIVSYRLSGTELLLQYPVTVPYGPYTDTAEVLDDGAITVRTKVYGLALGTVYVRSYRYQKR